MERYRNIICVCGILILVFFFLKWLNNEKYIVSDANDITVRFDSTIWPPHNSGPSMLFYSNRLVCPHIGGYSVYYLLSPDSNLILYIHVLPSEKEVYELYDIKKSKVERIKEIGLRNYHTTSGYLVGFSEQVDWQGSEKVVLSKDTSKDIVDLKNKIVEFDENGEDNKDIH